MISDSLLALLDCLPRVLSEEIVRMSGSYFDFEESLCEIRLRRGRSSSIVLGGRHMLLSCTLHAKSLSDALRALCGGSVYAHADSLRQGFICFSGGYRIGVAGRAVSGGDTLVDVGALDALCIRIPHAVHSAGVAVVEALRCLSDGRGVLVVSRSGGGKTTALRAAAAELSGGERPLRTVIVDSRGELGGEWFPVGHTVDILTGYPKAEGIEIATRTLSPELIVCDEIGGEREAGALLEVRRCGVPIIASAHGRCPGDLAARPALARLISGGLFGAFTVIKNSNGSAREYQNIRFDEVRGLFCGGEE